MRSSLWVMPVSGWKIRLEDRLEDNSIFRLSSSLYVVYNVRVTAILEDMEEFFTYSTFIDKILLRV